MTETLKEWYIQYVKQRDLMFRKIAKVDESKDPSIVTYKDDTTEKIIIQQEIKSFKDLLTGIKDDEKVSIVTENKKKHTDILISEWDKLHVFKYLTIVFINQNSLTEKKWLIKPYVHNRFTEKAALKPGIKALSSSVDLC